MGTYSAMTPTEIIADFVYVRGDLSEPEARAQLERALHEAHMRPILELHAPNPGCGGRTICQQECRDKEGTVVDHPCSTYRAASAQLASTA
jgi:hypothetical protein